MVICLGRDKDKVGKYGTKVTWWADRRVWFEKRPSSKK